MKYCVVGDVHGEFRALLNLASKTPIESTLVFVGDLVDRGTQSAEVIKFVREHNLLCVKGNHESMMIEYGTNFICAIEENRVISQDNFWLRHGGDETLLSYGLVSREQGKLIPHPFIKEFIFQFKEDIEWLKSLPLYLELNINDPISNRPIVISHAPIASVWDIRDKKEYENVFKETVLWHRQNPLKEIPIFNIFGHTPHAFGAEIEPHYVNIDTGCYIKGRRGYGILSAYCITTGEVYSSSDIN